MTFFAKMAANVQKMSPDPIAITSVFVDRFSKFFFLLEAMVTQIRSGTFSKLNLDN